MNISASIIREIRTEFARLKPAKVTLDGNRSMTVKEAVFALAPTIGRMKKRGFDAQEIAEKLHEKGIDVKPPTLVKYLNEYRRKQGQKKDKAGIAPTPVQAVPQARPAPQGFKIKPDTQLDEL